MPSPRTPVACRHAPAYAGIIRNLVPFVWPQPGRYRFTTTICDASELGVPSWNTRGVGLVSQ